MTLAFDQSVRIYGEFGREERWMPMLSGEQAQVQEGNVFYHPKFRSDQKQVVVYVSFVAPREDLFAEEAQKGVKESALERLLSGLDSFCLHEAKIARYQSGDLLTELVADLLRSEAFQKHQRDADGIEMAVEDGQKGKEVAFQGIKTQMSESNRKMPEDENKKNGAQEMSKRAVYSSLGRGMVVHGGYKVTSEAAIPLQNPKTKQAESLPLGKKEEGEAFPMENNEGSSYGKGGKAEENGDPYAKQQGESKSYSAEGQYRQEERPIRFFFHYLAETSWNLRLIVKDPSSLGVYKDKFDMKKMENA